MSMLNQFVTQLATFISDTPNTTATSVAWVVTIALLLFALLLLRWVFNWFIRVNEIVANQDHIIELLESRATAGASTRQSVVTPNLNMRPVASIPAMAAPNAQVPVRQHPIDDEFSEILNVRPHNMGGNAVARQQPAPQVVTPMPSTQQPAQASPNLRPPTLPNNMQEPSPVAPVSIGSNPQMEKVTPVPIQPQPNNTSVTMLGSPEARAERQLEAREAMRLAEQAANSTLSKTADIPDIPTALVRTYAASKTNPLTGKRVGDRSPSQFGDEDNDSIPNQFQLRNQNG